LEGYYYLKETKTTDEFVLNDVPIRFHVDAANMYEDTKEAITKTTENRPLSMVNEAVNASVIFQKTDGISGKGIPDTQFTLYRLDGESQTEVASVLTGRKDTVITWKDQAEIEHSTTLTKDGEAVFGGLDKGDYLLKESKAAIGYQESDSAEISFTITEDNKNQILNLTTEKTIDNQRIAGTVSLTKVNAENLDETLNNVEFTLYKKQEAENVFEKIFAALTGYQYSVTDSKNAKIAQDGTLTFTDLEWGDYYLVETRANDGYILDDTRVDFTIGQFNTSQTLALMDGKIVNNKNDLYVQKTDENGMALAGAALSLKGNFTDRTTEKQWISDGLNYQLHGLLKAGEVYCLTETAAPESYYRMEEEVYLSISENGKVSITDEMGNQIGDGTSSENGLVTITADNQLKLVNKRTLIELTGTGSVGVTKLTSNGGNAISVNKTFYAALFADEARTIRLTEPVSLVLSGTYQASAEFKNLPEGTYYISETDKTGIPLNQTESPFTITLSSESVNVTRQSQQSVFIRNDYEAYPEEFVPSGAEFAVTKKAAKDGKELTLKDETFYVALFADEDGMERMTEIRSLEFKNSSKAETTFEGLAPGIYYLKETDKDGNVLTGDEKNFDFTIEMDVSTCTIASETTHTDAVFTNAAKKDLDPSRYILEKETDKTNKSIKTSSKAKTGDANEIELYLFLAAVSAAGILLSMKKKKKA
ncbi:MAG: SpaA isopeptide-forming pilin-related protein, partial [Lachnospiraceae bacterium]|nr:SpaA isopeptide-forming pilin-related protein [Lachnospiraceae bacterium]